MTTDRDAVFLRALGKRIRIARLTRELTQAELADASGISRNFISLMEHGSHGVDVVRLLRIASAFGHAAVRAREDRRRPAVTGADLAAPERRTHPPAAGAT